MHRGTAGRLPHVRARTASAACARCAPWGALGPWTCGDWCRLAGPGSRIEPPAGAGCAAALPAQTIGVDDPPAAGASGRAQWHEMPPRVRRRGAARAPLSWWAGLRWNRRCSRRWGGGTARASAVTSPPPPKYPSAAARCVARLATSAKGRGDSARTWAAPWPLQSGSDSELQWGRDFAAAVEP